MDNVIILLALFGSTTRECHCILDGWDVVGWEPKVSGCKLVDDRVDFYDCGADAVGYEGGWGGTYSESTIISY
jgi:hypothetical protein